MTTPVYVWRPAARGAALHLAMPLARRALCGARTDDTRCRSVGSSGCGQCRRVYRSRWSENIPALPGNVTR